MSKKKRLMFPMACEKCGKQPQKSKSGEWELVKLECECGGRIKTDYSKPYYE